jgi:hypothetical protein
MLCVSNISLRGIRGGKESEDFFHLPRILKTLSELLISF